MIVCIPKAAAFALHQMRTIVTCLPACGWRWIFEVLYLASSVCQSHTRFDLVFSYWTECWCAYVLRCARGHAEIADGTNRIVKVHRLKLTQLRQCVVSAADILCVISLTRGGNCTSLFAGYRALRTSRPSMMALRCD